MNSFLFFAGILDDPDAPLPPIEALSPQTKERLIILGAMSVIILGAVIWAAFIRKRRKRKPNYHRHSNSSFLTQAAAAKVEITRMIKQSGQEKQRRRERHRPRNPTLADTGGLPPPRPASDPDSPPSEGQSHPG